MSKYIENVNAALTAAHLVDWQRRDEILNHQYDFYEDAEFEIVTEEELHEFMVGKCVEKVEPIDAPVTDGFLIYLGRGSSELWVAEIDYDDHNLEKPLTAKVAKLV